MKTSTQQDILQIIQQKGKVRPHELGEFFKISQVAVHKQLKKLVEKEQIMKLGRAPLVFYSPVTPLLLRVSDSSQVLAKEIKDFLDQTYLYVSPTGKLINGHDGFVYWVVQTKQEKFLLPLAQEYQKARLAAESLLTKDGWIEGKSKVAQAFPQDVQIDEIIFQDFYAIPKFGKTRLGQLVLHAKQAQSKELVGVLAKEAKPVLKRLIKKYKIDVVAFIPHSIPRKLPFLQQFREDLKLTLPELQIMKMYSGGIPVAQKSLSRLDERVQNARETIFVKENAVKFSNVLLIDDAVGSGATLNETARQLKQRYQVKKVFGYAIVGSMKGFDVIQEI